MRPEEYEFLYRLEETFWWFVGMRQITDTIAAKILKSGQSLRILDAGCGTGFNLSHYSKEYGHEVYGLDLSPNAIDGVKRRGFRRVCQASVDNIPFASGAFDIVTSFEVLCQGSKPPYKSGFREIARVLRPGGYMFVRLPAFQWMSSSHDIAVDTYHRFTAAEVAREVREVGLEIEMVSYANCFLFPAVLLRRMLKSVGIGKGSDVRPVPGAIDAVFRRILGAEASVFRRGGSLPFGLSVVCLARKPAASNE